MSDTPAAGHNSGDPIQGDQLKAFVERIERLNEEQKTIAEDVKEIYGEAKSNGFDVKVLRKVIARRARDRKEVEAEDELIDLYEAQTGIFG